MIRISKRLAALAALVTLGNTVADIGCDHGYLPIYLIQQRRIPRAIAMDVRPGPLSRAGGNIAAHGLLDYIETRISDGLEALQPGEAQTVVIAGMGGPLMERILSKGAGQLAHVEELILQPQSEVEHLRRFLPGLPFVVVDEDMVKEDGKFYPMMRLSSVRSLKDVKDGARWQDWEDADYRYGRYLLARRHPVLRGYLYREQEKLDRLEEGLRQAGSSLASERLAQIRREKEYVQEVRERYGFDM